jgi:eukaryotic-like serine/threonine-protein kinase
MTLTAGTRLGPYEILSPLGAGGMGEVYKARDSRLDRIVAIKVLPPHLSSSPDLRQRFEREAKAISRLSHPHICAIYDVGREGEIEYLVMEYLEGETLADRLGSGPLALDQTLRYGAEIADALDKAHRQGIVHRDLKPANVMLTPSGVKLLDFGLAKPMAPETPASDLTSDATAAARSDLTQEGTVLGTVPYMAPEQVEGKEADGRTDIFAFGATLYEMATGKRAFSGSSRISLITAILRDEPPPVSSIQPMTPPALDRVIRRCLAKSPENRWQNAADLASELRWIAEGASHAAAPVPGAPRSTRRFPLAWFVAGTLSVALAASVLNSLRPKGEAPKAIRFSLASPEKAEFFRHPASNSMAISPDGSRLAFVATAGAKTSLWVRSFDALAAVPLNGTEDAVGPFWSPDGRSIGFFAEGRLKKIAAAGGPPQALCDVAFANGGTWGRDGTILFTEWEGGREGIYRVSSEGGAATQVTAYDRARGERSQTWPLFLPDGRRFLYVSAVSDGSKQNRSLWTGSLDSRQVRRVMAVDSRVAYCAPGYLFFARDGTLLAEPFDAGGIRATGDPVPAGENVWFFRATGNASFAVSENGTVVQQAGPNPTRLTWRDRSGREIAAVGAPALFGRPRLSPDGSSIAVEVADPHNGTRDVWVYDSERGLPRRVTAVSTDAVSAIWSPAGDRIAFGSGGESALDIYVKDVNGSAPERPLLRQKGVQLPLDWSPDGSRILYVDMSPGRLASRQLWILSLTGKPEGTSLLRTPFSASAGRFSPDGKWISFVSEESGRSEVYVIASGGEGAMRRVSASGGSLPRWRRDGAELFYVAANGDFVGIPTRTAGGLETGAPSVLFNASPPPDEYDVAPDGRRFLFRERTLEKDVPLTVVVNRTAEFKKP